MYRKFNVYILYKYIYLRIRTVPGTVVITRHLFDRPANVFVTSIMLHLTGPSESYAHLPTGKPGATKTPQ